MVQVLLVILLYRGNCCMHSITKTYAVIATSAPEETELASGSVGHQLWLKWSDKKPTDDDSTLVLPFAAGKQRLDIRAEEQPDTS